MKRTAIIILNYLQYEQTINCIDSICKSFSGDYYLIVVDNASSNDSVDRIIHYFEQYNIEYHLTSNENLNCVDKQYTLIRMKNNVGYALGNNVGASYAKLLNCSNLIIMNSDIIVLSDIIPVMENFLNEHKDYGIVTPLLVKINGEIDYNVARKNPNNFQIIVNNSFLRGTRISRYINRDIYILDNNNDFSNNAFIPIDLFSGSCFMIKTDVFSKIGGFDGNTFLYFEENILYDKLKLYNYKSALIPNIKAVHIGAKSTELIPSTHLLKIALDSELYYLGVYRRVNKYLLFVVRIVNLLYLFFVHIYKKFRKQ